MNPTRFPQLLPLFLFLLLTCGTSHAYLLSAPDISREMIRQLGTTKSAVMDRQEIFYSVSEEAGEPRMVAGEFIVQSPHRLYGLLTEGEGRVETFITPFRWFRLVNGILSTEVPGITESWKLPMYLRQTSLFLEALRQRNVDTEITSLGRHEGRVAWVIGGKSSSRVAPDSPQFWVAKESFLPMRWILPAPGLKTMEIWYHDWFKGGNASWPGRIEFYRDGFLFREIRITGVRGVTPLKESAFDPSTYLVKSLEPAPAPEKPATDPQKEESQRRLKELEEILQRDAMAF